jgi:hypothetical protein
MTCKKKGSDLKKRFIVFALCASMLAGISACSNPSEKARLAVEQHLKDQKIQDLKLDLFCTNPSFPDKAYASVTVTHSFANAEGQPQKEYLGYILKQDGREWRVEHSATYTKEQQRAMDLVAGVKN